MRLRSESESPTTGKFIETNDIALCTTDVVEVEWSVTLSALNIHS